MKRILVYGMTDNAGGIETYLINLLEKVTPYGICLDFITDSSAIAYEETIKEKGSMIYYIPAKGKDLYGHLKSFFQTLHEHTEYKIVYMNLLNASGVITALIPKLLRREIIVHSHNGEAENLRIHQLFRPLLCFITDYYCACSNLAAQFMFGKKIASSGKVLLIPNAINALKFNFNCERRNFLRKKWSLEDAFVICHVGRITNQKNPYAVIDIFRELYKRDSMTKLLYIGKGDMEAEIKTYVKETKMTDHIFFWGERNDIADILQVADVFLLPSKYEGLPISALEAQAAGLPCVLSSNISGEVNITGNVVQLSLNDEWQTWADAILKFKDWNRKSVYSQIAASGYDLSTLNKELEKLIWIFNGK